MGEAIPKLMHVVVGRLSGCWLEASVPHQSVLLTTWQPAPPRVREETQREREETQREREAAHPCET